MAWLATVQAEVRPPPVAASVVIPIRCGEEGAELEGEALVLTAHLRSNHHLSSRALGSDQKNKITDTSS